MIMYWIRQDFRLTDNPALTHAIEQSIKQQTPLIALYIASPTQWQNHDYGTARLALEQHGIQAFQHQLYSLTIPIIYLTCETYHDIPEQLFDFCQQHHITDIFANRQYEYNEIQRDRNCIRFFRQASTSGLGIQTHWFHDQCFTAPELILNKQNKPYQIFSAYLKAVQDCLNRSPIQVLPAPSTNVDIVQRLFFSQISQFFSNEHLQAPPFLTADGLIIQANLPEILSVQPYLYTEQTAYHRLVEFSQHSLKNYKYERDFPNLSACSGLSSSLAIGQFNAKLAYLTVVHQSKLSIDNENIQKWFAELVWRDFYRYIMVHFPQVGRTHPFNLNYTNITWTNNTSQFQAWCQGVTGYPIIDASMRCLQQTKQLHNRLRMIVAMFLVKDLHIDWRWGEQYFAQQLLDFDFCSNNGNWQWCASCGVDAAPYFRIFNPITQSKTYDSEGNFIRQWLPELSHLGNKEIHEPYRHGYEGNYPKPIIDHATARKHTLELYQSALKPSNIE